MKEADMVKELKKFKKDELISIALGAIQALVPEKHQEEFLRKMVEIVEDGQDE